jgi:hypothetical protein
MSYPPPPSTDDLLEALEIFLREDVTPALEGYSQFRARVAVNILGMLRRGQVAGDITPERRAEIAAAATALRKGDVSWGDADILALARQENLARLNVSNPKWILDE